MEWFTLEMVIKMALTEAERKRKLGKLIAMDMPFDWNDPENFTGEDPVTVYSLINLYGEFIMFNQWDELRESLRYKYPDYF